MNLPICTDIWIRAAIADTRLLSKTPSKKWNGFRTGTICRTPVPRAWFDYWAIAIDGDA